MRRRFHHFMLRRCSLPFPLRRCSLPFPLRHSLPFPVWVAVTLLLAACQKNTPATHTPAFNISATINGAPTTFNAIITVDSLSTPGTVYIVAHSDSANLTPLLEITLMNTPLKTGVYPFALNPGGSDSTNNPDSTNSAGTPSSTLAYTLWNGGTAIQYPAVSDSVMLTTVSGTWFSGTFQGTCEYSADSIVVITNGQFTVGY